MKAIVTRSPGGLDCLELRELPDPGQPGPGQVRVKLHASSLNFHDPTPPASSKRWAKA